MNDKELELTDCVEWIHAFVRGGLPGQARLQQVISNIFIHYNIDNPKDQAHALELAGITPVYRENKRRKKHEITFDLDYSREPVLSQSF